MGVIQCVPNISEGKDMGIVEGLADRIRSLPGVALVDYSADPSHNRSVYTLLGDEEGIEEAAFQLVSYASQHIDMTQHQGEHPRMGAADVVPFIPVKDVSLDQVIQLSKRVGQRIYDELKIPVFLYEASASRPERKNLATIRKGQFEGMADKIKEADWAPDFGQAQIHPTAGATAVGARMPLVAFNVNLNTQDLAIAQAIAKAVRGSSGGYRHVKAMGVRLEEGQGVQVSMNLTHYKETPIYRVLETVRNEASRYGVQVVGSELIGLAPAEALLSAAEYYLQLQGFDYQSQVVEHHLI